MMIIEESPLIILLAKIIISNTAEELRKKYFEDDEHSSEDGENYTKDFLFERWKKKKLLFLDFVCQILGLKINLLDCDHFLKVTVEYLFSTTHITFRIM